MVDFNEKEFLVWKYKQLTGIEAGHWSLNRLRKETKKIERWKNRNLMKDLMEK